MRIFLAGLVAAGLLLVVGCGDDDDAARAEGASTGEFCAQYQAFDERFTGGADPGAEEVIAGVRALDPPAELREDVAVLIDGLEEIAGAVDVDDEEAMREFQADNPDLIAGLEEANASVEEFVAERCGTDPANRECTSNPDAEGCANRPDVESAPVPLEGGG